MIKQASGRIANHSGSRSRHDESQPVSSRLMVAISIAGSRVMNLLPRQFREWGTDQVAETCWRVARTLRQNSIANIRQVVGPEVSAKEVERLARRAFHASAQNIADLIWYRSVPVERFSSSVQVTRGDWAAVDRALANGRGLVMVTGHLGPFDAFGHVLAAKGYPLTAIAGRTLPKPLFDAAVVLRAAQGTKMVEPNAQGVRQVVAALRAGECVVFVGDRDFFGNGFPVEFFGRKTTLPSGAVRLARTTGAPIIAGFARRTATGYALEFDEPFTVPSTTDRAADVKTGMDYVVTSLTRAIAAAPEDWLVFQPVWPLEF